MDSTGNVTPVAPGTAHITATAQDACKAVSNTFTINVTPAQNRADNQKLNLDPVASKQTRININDHLAWPKNVGEGNIALWSGNATGAISLSVDDSLEYDFATWKSGRRSTAFRRPSLCRQSRAILKNLICGRILLTMEWTFSRIPMGTLIRTKLASCRQHRASMSSVSRLASLINYRAATRRTRWRIRMAAVTKTTPESFILRQEARRVSSIRRIMSTITA